MGAEQHSRGPEMSSFPGPVPHPAPLSQVRPHRGVRVSGSNGEDGRKAFYIHIEALSGKETEVVRMLEDVRGSPAEEPEELCCGVDQRGSVGYPGKWGTAGIRYREHHASGRS